jgi:hypothetical protein
MAYLRGARLVLVTIVPNGPYRGGVWRESLTLSNTEHWDAEDYEAFFYDHREQPTFAKCDVKTNADTDIMISLAGEIAQRLYSPRSSNRGSQKDFENAHDTLRRYVEASVRAAEAYINYLKIRAEEALRNNWLLVEALVVELLRRRTLTGGEVEQILREIRFKRRQSNTTVKCENWGESSEMR